MKEMRWRSLRSVLLGLLGLGLSLLVSCQTSAPSQHSLAINPATTPAPGSIQLPPLPYNYDALEPYIDAATLQLHHDKHHAAYVNKLNEALKPYPDLQSRSVADLVQSIAQLPEPIRKAVQDQGGGHLNHSMFWKIMAPQAGGTAFGEVGRAIAATFGSFDSFKQQFEQAGVGQFGSGWVWLVLTPQGQLQITTTTNQDSPVMQGLYPILGNDLWEHAYYLKYRNQRQEYLKAWWNVVNWAEVDRRLTQARTMQVQNVPVL